MDKAKCIDNNFIYSISIGVNALTPILFAFLRLEKNGPAA